MNSVEKKLLVKVKYISLVNLIMDKEIVKELIQQDFTSENISIELGYMQTSQESLTFSGTSIGSVNYTGNLNASFSGADLGLVLHPSQGTGFKNLFLDLGFTNYTVKESGNISTNIASYSPSQNESGTGHYYGLGYDLTLHNDYVIRGTINHYDNIGGNSGISGNVGSIGIIKKY